MKYELWKDLGDNRYAIKHPIKYIWLELEGAGIDNELFWWQDMEYDDSLGELEEDFFRSLAGDLVYLGEFDTFAEAYEVYQLEELLNA